MLAECCCRVGRARRCVEARATEGVIPSKFVGPISFRRDSGTRSSGLSQLSVTSKIGKLMLDEWLDVFGW